MAATQKVMVNGAEGLGVEVEFEIKSEAWNEYNLLDGGTIRVKCNAIYILRLVDNKGKQLYADEGTPLFVVRTRQDVAYRA